MHGCLPIHYHRSTLKEIVISKNISRFDMSCAQAHWVGSKPIRRVIELKLHKPTMVIGYSRHVDSNNPGRSNVAFRSKPIPEAELSNRFINFFPTYMHRFSCELDENGIQ